MKQDFVEFMRLPKLWGGLGMKLSIPKPAMRVVKTALFVLRQC